MDLNAVAQELREDEASIVALLPAVNPEDATRAWSEVLGYLGLIVAVDYDEGNNC